MKINKLRWKNFTSWGNSWNELNFDTPSGLTLICGVNGSGKSSISNLIIYMLYGQLDSFTLSEIPNRINKNFEGEIYLTSNGHKIYIYRGLMPKGFKVIVDDKEINIAGKNNIQKWLEDEIYCMSYDIFKNSIVLSINDFKSFVDLTPKEKRNIIDKLFGYEVINYAYSKVKETLKKINADIIKHRSTIEGYNLSLIEIDESIKTILEREDNSEDIFSKLSSLRIEIDNRKNERDLLQNEIDTNLNKINSLRSEEIRLKNELLGLKKNLELYNNGECPTCGSSLTDERHIKIKNDILNNCKKIKELYLENKENLQSIDSYNNNKVIEKGIIDNIITNLNIDITKLDTTLKNNEKLKGEQLNNLNTMRDSIKNKILPNEKSLITLNSKEELLTIVSNIFSENGLKEYISNIYIPIINSYVTNICEKLSIPYKVLFTKGYDCEISFMGEVVKYKTLSNGERKKIDIAVTLAFLKIIKTKVSDINLLFLDEVLSSIDVSSCNELLKIFYDFSVDTKLRTYIVHHANLDSNNVDNVIEIEKVNGFSHFEKK